MSAIDWVVFFLFLGYVVWDGSRRGVQARNLEGYFAGGRQIPWWAAGLSVMATQASAITVMGTTGQGHEGGMDYLQTYFGLPFAMILLCIFLVPLLRENPILTAYEYLESRFGPATRTLASMIFLVSRCLALGAVIYAPSVVLAALTGFNLSLTLILIGVLTTAYTVLGGINAVVWTDVKQMTVIFLGLFACLAVLLSHLLPEMGFWDMLQVMGASGKLNALETEPASWKLIPNFVWETDAPRTFWQDRYNLWSGLLGGLFLMLAYFGCDQSQAQRILTNSSANESRKTLLLSAFTKVPMQILILFLGALLFLFNVLGQPPLFFNPEHRVHLSQSRGSEWLESLEQRYREKLDKRRALARELADNSGQTELLERYRQSIGEVSAVRGEAGEALRQENRVSSASNYDTNYIFPHFMLAHLPPVLLGLLIAAIFAAAMSSIDSVLNSLSAATIVDFYKRWWRPEASEPQALWAGRVTTLLWGIVATYAAFFFQGGGSIVEQINRVGSYFYGSLLGVFVLALVCRQAGPRAGFLGLIGGMTTVIAVHNTFRVEFLWYNIVGCLGVLVVGVIASRFERT